MPSEPSVPSTTPMSSMSSMSMSSKHALADHPLVVAITGASGAVYGIRLLEVLLAAEREIHLTISGSGQAVILEELGRRIDLDRFDLTTLWGNAEPRRGGSHDGRRLHYHHYKDLLAPIASGSFLTAAMAICPCSGSTLASVAHALGENLIHRAAEVHLKERRRLVVVPRETPLSLPQLRNMQAIHEAGAVVLPAAPGFYHGATTLEDLVDFVVARICDQLQVPHALMRRWGEGS